MQRICHDVSVQTDAGASIDQFTQVNIHQSTQWTQCTVSQTDQSVQATCRQSLAAVQVAPETSDAVIQTEIVVAEPAVQLSSAVTEDTHLTESEVIGYHPVEEGSCIVTSDKGGYSAAVEPVIESIEDSPSHSDTPSSSERPKDHSTAVTGANITCDMYDEIAAQSPVTSETVSAVSEQLSKLYDGDEDLQVPAVVQRQFPPTVVSATYQRAVLQPSFNISTASEYVNSFQQQTFQARSLLQRSCEIRSVYQSESQAVVTQNIPIQQLAHEMPLISNTQALVIQNATQTCAANAKPLLEVCAADPVVRLNEVSSHASKTDAVLISNAGEAHHSSSGSSQPSTNLQPSTFSLSVDSSSSQLHTAVGQELSTEKPTACASLPSVPNDPTQNASLPIREVIKSANVPYSSHSTAAHVQESVANSARPGTRDITAQITNIKDAMSHVDVVLLEYDSGKFGSHKQSENVLECENTRKQQCELATAAGELQSTPTCDGNNSVSCLSNIDVSSAAHTSTRARNEQCNNKEQRITGQTEMDSNVVELSEGMVTRGRRRPLFVCRGPLMETVMTLEGTDNTSLYRDLYKDVETSNRRLPVMLGMCDCHLQSVP